MENLQQAERARAFWGRLLGVDSFVHCEKNRNCGYNKEKLSWFRNAIANLYDAVSAPVAAAHNALSKRLGDIREKVTDLYNKTRGRQPQKTLKDIFEERAYDGIEDIKHMYGREKAGSVEGLRQARIWSQEGRASGWSRRHSKFA